MYIGNIEITKRELLASIIIIFIMTGLGFLVASKIHDSVSVANERYFKSLKIDNDEEMFNYTISTEVGNVLSFGTVQAIGSVSDEMIEGEFFALMKKEEHYVQKTRTVTYTDSNGVSRTRTEVYYEWEEKNREYDRVDSFTYLGREFTHDDIKIDNYAYLTTEKNHFLSDVRYKFYIIPLEQDITLFAVAKDKTIQDTQVHYSQSIEQIIDYKEREADVAVIVFWVVWVLLTIGAVIGFVALDNRYLNNH